MPKFVSIVGKFYPAKEYYVNPDARPGENPVYEGPDRAAMDFMRENGHLDEKGNIISYPGQDAFADPDNMMRARQLGYKNVEEMLEGVFGITRKSIEEKAKQTLAILEPHDNKKPRTPDRSGIGGGRDYSGQGKDRLGGFGDPSDVSGNALNQRA